MDTQTGVQIEELRHFFLEKGFHLPVDLSLESGDKPTRFKRDANDSKSNCYLYIHQMNHSSKPGHFLVATAGDWSTGEEYSFRSGGMSYDDFDKQAIESQIAKAKKRAFLARLKVQKETAVEAANLFGAGEQKPHPYVKKKNLGSSHGALVSPTDNALMVPMRGTEGKLWGLQRIYNNGGKFFLSGQRVDELFHAIPHTVDVCRESLLILCEGFATGASIHEATGRTVVCTFSAGNLVKVARALFKDNPDAAYIIAGDDDKTRENNPGAEAAEKARIICNGTTVLPQFPFQDDESTDFNDLHATLGLEEVKNQIERAVAAHTPTYVRCLGAGEEGYYFISSRNKTLDCLSSVNQSTLLELMPIEYWTSRYSKEKKEGVCDWQQAASDMIDRCILAGRYRPSNVRSRGVWLDEKRLVVHLGDRLWVNGQETELNGFKGRYHYVLEKSDPSVHPQPLTVGELAPYREAIRLMKLRDPWSKTFLQGWPIQALLGGALKWRTHLHLTAEKGTGKTAVIEEFLWPILGCRYKSFGIGTTEPGIRADLKNSALVGSVDEFESTSRNGQERLAQILEYIRQSSTGGEITKGGGAKGTSIRTSAHSTFLMGSIHDPLYLGADATRFIQINLLKVTKEEQQDGQWLKLSAALKKISQNDFSERFFSRCVHSFAQFTQSQELLAQMVREKYDGRIAQLWSGVLAGAHLIESDEVITKEKAAKWIEEIQPDQEKATSLEHEWQSLIDHMTSVRVAVQNAKEPIQMIPLSSVIRHDAALLSQDHEKGLLPQFGMKIFTDKHGKRKLFIHPGNAELKKIVRDHPMAASFKTALLRIPGAENDRQDIHGTKRGVSIPLLSPASVNGEGISH